MSKTKQKAKLHFLAETAPKKKKFLGEMVSENRCKVHITRYNFDIIAKFMKIFTLPFNPVYYFIQTRKPKNRYYLFK